MSKFPNFHDVRAAAQRIGSAIVTTPCLHSQTLSEMTGCRLHLKFENHQFTASFKERGALNRLLQLTPEQCAAGVCAVSAGNHAQGVAYHANRLGIAATIVMPIGTPATKVARTRDHGATVLVAGINLTEALNLALTMTEQDGLTFIHPFDDPAVISGQGTIGAEILEAVPDVETLVVPIGGGGLISGIAIAARTLRPEIRIIGVQSHAFPSMARALVGDESPCPDQLTIAEGIAVKSAGKLTRMIIRDLVDDVLLVSEEAIERAIALLLSVEKTVAEGAGATGLAALLEYPQRFAGSKVATVLSGGNIDLRVLASVAMRELVRSGQLIRLAVPISDQPGMLSTLATVFGDAGANIVDVAHDRLSLTLSTKRAVVEFTAEVRDDTHRDLLLVALRESGFEPNLHAI